MRIKKFNKKLALNKETIVHLDNRQMKNAAGGEVTKTGPCTVKITGNPCEDICATQYCPTSPIVCTNAPC